MSYKIVTYDKEKQVYKIEPPLKLFSRSFETVSKRALEALIEANIVTGLDDLLSLDSSISSHQNSR